MQILENLDRNNSKPPVMSILTGFLGLAYVTGYIISALFLRHRGISPLPLLKAQYIETGLAFLIVTVILAGIPFLIIQMAYSDKESRQRWKMLRILITAFVTTNYLLVIALVVIFVESEWRTSATVLGFTIQFNAALIPYLLLTIIFLIIPRILLTAQLKTKIVKSKWAIVNSYRSVYSKFLEYRGLKGFLVVTCRVASLIGTVVVDYLILRSFSWLPCFIGHISMYIYAIFYLVIAIFVVSWFAKGIKKENIRVKIWCVGVPAFLLCYYMCIMAYSYRVYPNVPSSRGGKYPTSEYIIHYAKSHVGTDSLPQPLYVLEETDKFLYGVAVKGCEWYYNDDKVYVIPISHIDWMELTKLLHAEPRSWLCSLSEPHS